MKPSQDDDHAEAFRRGYERARRGAEPTVPLHELMDRREPPTSEEPTAAEATAPVERVTGPIGQPVDQPVHAPPDYLADYRAEERQDERERRRPPVALLLGVLALLLIAGAFGIGRLFADNASQGSSGGAGGSEESAVYDGQVHAVQISDSMASCQADSSVDAAGNPVTYEPAKAHDADLSTAWRCNGSGVGQRFTVTLPEGTKVAEVGLVPGYAKTDPASGVDRYAENNRITKVRWTFDDGTSFEQEMSGSPRDRSMRTMRVPETSTSRVVMEILRSQPGPRNTVAISEIQIGTPAS